MSAKRLIGYLFFGSVPLIYLANRDGIYDLMFRQKSPEELKGQVSLLKERKAAESKNVPTEITVEIKQPEALRVRLSERSQNSGGSK